MANKKKNAFYHRLLNWQSSDPESEAREIAKHSVESLNNLTFSVALIYLPSAA